MKRFIAFSLLAAVGCVALFVVLPMVSDARYARGSEQVRNDLKHVMLALHNYHDEHHSFPPAFVVGPDGKRWHSWRSQILKDIDPELANRYRFDEPWDGPNNSKLHRLVPAVFQSELAASSDSAAHYRAIVGRRTVWPAHQSVSIRQIWDRTSNTMMLIEDRNSNACWLAPKDMLAMDALRALETNSKEQPRRGTHFAFVDGSVKAMCANYRRPMLSSVMTAGPDELYHGDRLA